MKVHPLVNGLAGVDARSIAMFERHFTVRTLSELWGWSEDTVQRTFEDEPGVLKSGNDGCGGKRRKVMLRIPESIAARVYQKLTK